MSALYAIKKETLESIGNAIRTATGTSDKIPVSELPERIAGMSSSVECTLRGAFRCNQITYSESITEGIEHQIGGSVTTYMQSNPGKTYTATRISIRSLPGSGTDNYVNVYSGAGTIATRYY